MSIDLPSGGQEPKWDAKVIYASAIWPPVKSLADELDKMLQGQPGDVVAMALSYCLARCLASQPAQVREDQLGWMVQAIDIHLAAIVAARDDNRDAPK